MPDLWGPTLVSARNGARYFMTMIDDFLRKVWIFFLREKSEAFMKFKVWKTKIEKK